MADMSSETELMLRVDTRVVQLRAKLFRGLGDSSRLAILDALRAGPRSVGEIVASTGLSQPNASNHLRCLNECGLVAGEQRGRFVHYRLSDPHLETLLSLADELVAGTAQGVYPCRNYEPGKSD
ncbi:putative ArsR family transcriptional regulator; MerR/ArsR-like transcriptional regulator (plasmid) [Pseudorhizobium banfieldiae]|nr:putative ArsR family transcriptional regulator; MerR/ArsR-like transcriptional regulator [Pseudorhizobium banfieldiae]